MAKVREWTVTRIWRVTAPTAVEAFEAAKPGGHFKAWASEIVTAKKGWTKGPNTVVERRKQ